MKSRFTNKDQPWRSNAGLLKQSLKTIFSSITAVITVAVFLLLPFSKAYSAQEQVLPWKGQEVVRSHAEIKMRPGAEMTFEIHFKNVGTETWKNDGPNFVALATIDPAKRTSSFHHKFWPDEVTYRPAYLLQSAVQYGETGIFRFALKAPLEEGFYEESFQAVAKNIAWIEGTKFVIPIKVTSDPKDFEKKVVAPQQMSTESVSDQASIPKTIAAPLEQGSSCEGFQSGITINADYPVRDSAYTAEWVCGNKVLIQAEPGQKISRIFEVKNAGSKTWKNYDWRFISGYTVRPNYHTSAFKTDDAGWISSSQVKLTTDQINPGQVGEMKLLLQAPNSTGTYSENIRLAVEDYSWIKDGELIIEIIVKEPAKQVVVQTPTETNESKPTIYKDTAYQATYLVSSAHTLTLSPGQTTSFQVGFKNTGTKPWARSGARYISMYTIDPNYRASRFSTKAAVVNEGWLQNNQIGMAQEVVAPGQLAFFRFDVTAPVTPGSYTEKFRLAVEDHSWIEGGEFSLPIIVEGGTGTLPVINNPDSSRPTAMGPIMRVGIFDTVNHFSITSDSPYQLQTVSGELLASFPARTKVSIDYVEASGVYTVNSVSFNGTFNEAIVAKALDEQTIMEILSLERRLPWNQAVNENLFRGSIEIHHSDATNKTWAINILPMEQYLKGIAETSSESPVEFLKVMSVAARTYATYHYERQSKHADEHFYVDSEFDQVYKGYALEKRHPGLVEAVNETAGEVVTYTDPQTLETKIAITPYFSRSDGRTRDWSEVWGGEVAWAKSVPVPQDVGKTLLGHGVGMSARGGLLMVADDGATYDEVLHYFFKGIQIQDRY